MNMSGFLAVGAGGAMGCWLRWGLGALFNPIFPTLPLGTLAANLTGGLLMGGLLVVFDHVQTLPPVLRLLLLTGFLGGLTTFSTFSAESTHLLLGQRYLWFAGHMTLHVIGALGATTLGLVLARVAFARIAAP